MTRGTGLFYPCSCRRIFYTITYNIYLAVLVELALNGGSGFIFREGRYTCRIIRLFIQAEVVHLEPSLCRCIRCGSTQRYCGFRI